MAKFEKIFIGDECQNCGALLMVTTSCSEENDVDGIQYFYDGDAVRCTVCGFISAISINEDGEPAYVADGNIDELNEVKNFELSEPYEIIDIAKNSVTTVEDAKIYMSHSNDHSRDSEVVKEMSNVGMSKDAILSVIIKLNKK